MRAPPRRARPRGQGAGSSASRRPSRGQLSATGAVPPKAKGHGFPARGRVSPGLHSAIPRHARAADARGGSGGPALGILRRHSPAADSTGSTPLPQQVRSRTPHAAPPALRFALPPLTLPTLHAAPRAGVGVPVRLRAPPRPARAPPRPPRTYRSGPPAPHLPARTCRGARSLAAGGRGSGGKRPVAVATAPGGACAERRGAERGSPEPRDYVGRAPCRVEAALRHGAGQGTYCVPRGGVTEHCPPRALLLRIPDQLSCSFSLIISTTMVLVFFFLFIFLSLKNKTISFIVRYMCICARKCRC